MISLLERVRKKIVLREAKESSESGVCCGSDDKIALGVLLWVVAEADEKFLPQEEEKIREIIRDYSGIQDESLAVVMEAIRVAAQERIDLYTFTSEISSTLDYSAKVSIVESLFRVGCADGVLSEEEVEAVRKISNLFHISHRDFIAAKIKVKKEFGIKVGGE